MTATGRRDRGDRCGQCAVLAFELGQVGLAVPTGLHVNVDDDDARNFASGDGDIRGGPSVPPGANYFRVS